MTSARDDGAPESGWYDPPPADQLPALPERKPRFDVVSELEEWPDPMAVVALDDAGTILATAPYRLAERQEVASSFE